MPTVVIPDDVKKEIQYRVDNGIYAGIVVGILDSNGTGFYSYGVKSNKTNEPLDENTIFEIGSISKSFTGLLLADMVIKNEVKFDDPLQKYLPEGVTAPTFNGDSIKLINLADHTSGLPYMPVGGIAGDFFREYSEKQSYDLLNNYELTYPIGSKLRYSNYAVGLLGHTLARINNMNYEELLIERICKPLGLNNTRVIITPEMQKNIAVGHKIGIEQKYFGLSTLAGAASIHTNAVDLLKYVSANMGQEETDLYPAMQLMHKISRDRGNGIMGIGWRVRPSGKNEIVERTGATSGFFAFAGFIKGPDGDKGVVVLANSKQSVLDIGMHLLYPKNSINHRKPSMANKLGEEIDKNGIEAGIKTFWELKTKNTHTIVEYEMNTLGYLYLQNNEIEKALAVFELNTELFPNLSNPYDSYGEALMKNGENEKAIANYKRSLELYRGNLNAIEMLKKLGVDTDSLMKEIQRPPLDTIK